MLSYLNVSPIISHSLIVVLIVVHFILDFRRLREIDYYRDDPLVLRLIGLILTLRGRYCLTSGEIILRGNNPGNMIYRH